MQECCAPSRTLTSHNVISNMPRISSRLHPLFPLLFSHFFCHSSTIHLTLSLLFWYHHILLSSVIINGITNDNQPSITLLFTRAICTATREHMYIFDTMRCDSRMCVTEETPIVFFREKDAFLKHRDVSCRHGRRADFRIFQPGNIRARFSARIAFLPICLRILHQTSSDYRIVSPSYYMKHREVEEI